MARKLNAFTRLSREDVAALDEIARNVVSVEPRRDVVSEGDRPEHVRLVLEGWAARHKSLPGGKRQIVGLFVPGDFCDLNVYILRRMDHSISAITRVKLALITPEQMDELTTNHPRVAQALLWHELVTAAIQASGCSTSASAPRTSGSRICCSKSISACAPSD